MRKVPRIVAPPEPQPEPLPDTVTPIVNALESSRVVTFHHAEATAALAKAIADANARIIAAIRELGHNQGQTLRVKIVRDSDGDMDELIITRE